MRKQNNLPLNPLNYNVDVTLINLRDIRFSQFIISEPLQTSETLFKDTLDNYPYKFFNYDDKNLILLGMFGEDRYQKRMGLEYKNTPTVPSLRVVHFPNVNECYVSVDNRRLALIYRSLLLLLYMRLKGG